MPNIYGKNPVVEAINAGKTINKIYFQKQNKDIYDVVEKAKQNKIVTIACEKIKLDRMITNEGEKLKNSQGIVASVTEFIYSTVDEIIEKGKNENKKTNSDSNIIVILDKIEDPHNLGAIIRSVDCLGADGVIIQKRNAAQITDTVEKVSAGATAHVKVSRVTNISETIKYLKEKGYWIYGLDMEGKTKIYDAKLEGKIGIVIGNEGEGISRLVLKNCDVILNIPMEGKVNSLNASVSNAIMLYEILRQRNK